MIVFNICAAPGGGKSTAAADLFAAFKKEGYHAELVGEAARDFIYAQGKAALYDNQFLIGGLQWERLYRLYRCGIEVAISDSPLIQGLLYASHMPYYNELKALLQQCDSQFPAYNVFVHRTAPYVEKNRNQTEAESDALIPKIRQLVPNFWLEVEGNTEGLTTLRTGALALAAGLLRR